MSESNVSDRNLIRISLFESEIGFQNPAFNDSFDLERPKLNGINSITSESKNYIHTSKNRFEPITRSVILKDVDIVCCKKVFTIKANTYSNFKRCGQMLFPFGILIVLILILIVLFRVDVFVQNEDKFDD